MESQANVRAQSGTSWDACDRRTGVVGQGGRRAVGRLDAEEPIRD
jgi:hypothetical protein